MEDDRIFVAVGLEIEECRMTVEWAAKNAAKRGGYRIVLLHVFQPILWYDQSRQEYLDQKEEQEEDIDEVLSKCEAICSKEMVETDKLAIAHNDIVQGIIEQVYKLEITKLVMGAAADRRYFRLMSKPTSEKANIVLEQAHQSCRIWFVCNGKLVYIRITGSRQRSPSRVGSRGISQSPPPSSRSSISSEGSISPPVNEDFRSTPGEQVYKQLAEAMAKVDIARRQLSDEVINRQKVEKDAYQAARKAKAAEASYAKETKQRRKIEEQLESLRIEQLRVIEELQKRREIEKQLESLRIEQLRAIEELQQKFSAAKERLMIVQRERDELLREREDAVTEVVETRWQRNQEEAASSSRGPLAFSEYMLSELKEATNLFDEKMKIGAGGFGIVYKCRLRHTLVAVKTLRPGGMHGRSEIQQEVDVLSKVRHPNLVALIGACQEHPALVYEYLPNGSLKDWLHRMDDTTSLSWQIRTRIALEICSALIFLHSRKPDCIVHGDLKPDNILLDSNFVSKLGDFGLCRLILRGEDSKASLCLPTEPKGTIGYIDPEFAGTGQLTPRSDVYSYGIVLLQLLTGKPAKGLQDIVEKAMNNDGLHTILDRKAGGWPFVQAMRFARIALKCCERNRHNRPDLKTEVCSFFEKMMTLVGPSASSSRLSTSMDAARIPSHFVCPISLVSSAIVTVSSILDCSPPGLAPSSFGCPLIRFLAHLLFNVRSARAIRCTDFKTFKKFVVLTIGKTGGSHSRKNATIVPIVDSGHDLYYGLITRWEAEDKERHGFQSQSMVWVHPSTPSR